MHTPTNTEMHTLPHTLLTSDAVWDPSTIDDGFTIDELAQDASFDPTPVLDIIDPRVTSSGEYTGNLQDDIDLVLADCQKVSSSSPR